MAGALAICTSPVACELQKGANVVHDLSSFASGHEFKKKMFKLQTINVASSKLL